MAQQGLWVFISGVWVFAGFVSKTRSSVYHLCLNITRFLFFFFFEELHVTKEERPWNKGQRSALWVSGWLTAKLSLSCLTQAMVGQECVGAIVCKLDMHKKMFRRGYIAMLAVDSKHRRKSIGEICLCLFMYITAESMLCSSIFLYFDYQSFNANWRADKLDAPDWSVTLSTYWAEQECCFSKSSCYICATDFRLFFFRY